MNNIKNSACHSMSLFAIVSLRQFVWLVFLFFFLIFPFSAFAVSVCGNKIYLDIDGDDSTCANTPVPTCWVPAGCSSATLVQNLGCVFLCNVCCENPQVSEQSVYGSNTVTEVPFGTEDQAAALALQNWLTTASTPTCPVGYHKTGENHGAAYESYLSPDTLYSQVDIDYWVRAACTSDASGQSLPLGSLIGSGGGTGITQAEVTTAVDVGVNNVETGITSLDTHIEALNTKIDTTNEKLSSIDSKVGSGGSGGISGSDVLAALEGASNLNAIKDSLTSSGAVNAPVGAVPVAYVNENLPSSGSLNFSTLFTSFLTDMKQTQLFSHFSLSPLGAVSGGSSAFSVSFGSFGNMSLDLADYSSGLNILKGFLLLLASYLAVRVVVLKR